MNPPESSFYNDGALPHSTSTLFSGKAESNPLSQFSLPSDSTRSKIAISDFPMDSSRSMISNVNKSAGAKLSPKYTLKEVDLIDLSIMFTNVATIRADLGSAEASEPLYLEIRSAQSFIGVTPKMTPSFCGLTASAHWHGQWTIPLHNAVSNKLFVDIKTSGTMFSSKVIASASIDIDPSFEDSEPVQYRVYFRSGFLTASFKHREPFLQPSAWTLSPLPSKGSMRRRRSNESIDSDTTCRCCFPLAFLCFWKNRKGDDNDDNKAQKRKAKTVRLSNIIIPQN